MPLLLVEFDVAVDDAGTVETWRAATEGYNHSSAPGFFPEVIQDSISITREIRGEEDRRRAAAVDFSDLVLINADGRFDALIDYGFDGRAVRGYLVDDAWTPWDERVALFAATMGPPSFDLETITIPIRDRLAEFEQPFHFGTYEREHSLDGTDTTKGSPRPAPEGWCYNVQIPLVNEDRKVYQFADTEVDADVADVFIGGVRLARGDDYTSQEDMEDNPPDGSEYRCWPRKNGEGGYIRMPGSPIAAVTANIETLADNRIGSVFKRLALRAPTITEDDISQGDIDALNDAMPWEVGAHADFEVDLLDELERLCRGAGVWFGFDRFGYLRLGIWNRPEPGGPRFIVADPVDHPVSAHEYDIEEFEAEPTEDRDLPAYSVTVQFARNHTVQPGLQTDQLEAERRAWLEREWTREKAKDESVRDKHKSAQEIEVESAWATRDGAEDAAARILERAKTRAIRAVVTTWMGRGVVDDVELAGNVEVRIDRYGMKGGRAFRVRRINLDPVENRIELGVWG